ncbi:uncharacterized protein VTP21DRAFT_8637 [Calcarisporiella thermophila]|uniref:uncharacterized protein n=1 Tax=Calcarisporiella thermophila TaxID=911321 RepID=UPI003742829A
MDAFRLLCSGARFDRKRFRNEIDLFQPEITQKEDSENTDEATQANLLQEIDFFKSTKTSSKPTEKTKKDRKRKTEKIAGNQETEQEDTIPDLHDRGSTFKNQDEVIAFRKENRIKIYGNDVPNPLRTFDDLTYQYELLPYLNRNLKNAGYDMPTPIQMQSIPIILHGREIIACAPTGSGKTLSYILPILHELKAPEKIGYRALIISPTRELAQQIYREIKRLGTGKKFKICMLTKATAATQANDPKLRQKFDILISTPLRLVHAIQNNHVELNHVKHLVLDEADKLLELGFLEQTDEIFAACSSPRLQKLLFSATIPAGVEELAKTVMKDPIRVVIGTKNAATETIEQKLIYVGQEEGKLIAIRQMVQEGGLKPPALIFVQSIERAKELFHELIYDGINVDVIHSERTKAQRDNIVDNFRTGRIWVLIATELMARGMDFKGVNLVINYDFPQTVQSYIHRIGRTGRAGKSGSAVTLFTKDDAPYLKSIVNVMRESGCEVPEWMLQLHKPSKDTKKNLKRAPPKRKTINTMSEYDKKKLAHKKEIIENSKKRKLRQLDAKNSVTQETTENESSTRDKKLKKRRENTQK